MEVDFCHGDNWWYITKSRLDPILLYLIAVIPLFPLMGQVDDM